jgi:hypothetical protein
VSWTGILRVHGRPRELELARQLQAPIGYIGNGVSEIPRGNLGRPALWFGWSKMLESRITRTLKPVVMRTAELVPSVGGWGGVKDRARSTRVWKVVMQRRAKSALRLARMWNPRILAKGRGGTPSKRCSRAS